MLCPITKNMDSILLIQIQSIWQLWCSVTLDRTKEEIFRGFAIRFVIDDSTFYCCRCSSLLFPRINKNNNKVKKSFTKIFHRNKNQNNVVCNIVSQRQTFYFTWLLLQMSNVNIPLFLLLLWFFCQIPASYVSQELHLISKQTRQSKGHFSHLLVLVSISNQNKYIQTDHLPFDVPKTKYIHINKKTLGENYAMK